MSCFCSRGNALSKAQSAELTNTMKSIEDVYPRTHFICLLNKDYDVHATYVNEKSCLKEPEELLQPK